MAAVFAVTAFTQSTSLKVGDPAPKLEVGKWLKGDEVPNLDHGKIYVVEFWATWCGPCKQSIPHLTELHKKFGDKATFIGVSSFETNWDGVAPFVAGEGDQMDYDVAMDKLENPKDREGFMAKNWMEAAHQDGIPTAFVVDKDGKIAWIGHPMELEGPLTKIVDGTWDRAAAEKAFDKAAAAQKAQENSPLNVTYAAYGAAMKNKDYEKAIAAADKLGKIDPRYENLALNLKLPAYAALNKGAEYDKAARKLMASPMGKDPTGMNQIAWYIVDPESKLSPRNLKLAHELSSKAVELTGRKQAELIDTLAWCEYWMGHKSQAADLEKEAMSKVDGDKTTYETALKRFSG
jgi:thiol-disulfide isomerase/thioredoxin